MLAKIARILSLTMLLAWPIRADASMVDEYAQEAFGETGTTWRMTGFKALGSITVVSIVPDRNIGIVAADLLIRADGELYGVSVQFGPARTPVKPMLRIR